MFDHIAATIKATLCRNPTSDHMRVYRSAVLTKKVTDNIVQMSGKNPRPIQLLDLSIEDKPTRLCT